MNKILKKIIFLALLAGTAYPVWNIETIDTGTGVNTDVGWYSSLAIDGSGYAHVSYLSYNNNDLMYITNKTGSWVKTTVDTAGGYQTSIALDTSGYPNISYIAGGNLKHAGWNGSTWTLSTRASADNTCGTAIVVDGSNNIHISYSESWGSGPLKYEKYAGSWNATTSITNLDAPMDSSIAMNGANPYIAYLGNGGDAVHFARWNGSAWLVDGGPTAIANSCFYTSMKLNSSNNPCVSYQKWNTADLRYAVWGGASWTTQDVDTAGDTGWWTSLALDGSNYAHISYQDHASWDLKYATNKTGGWVINKVDSNGGVGYCTSIKLDGSGNPHISYYDVANKVLKYAKWINGTYTISGYLRDSGSTPIFNAVVFLSGGATGNYVSDATGYYEFTGLSATNFTITPALAGTTFSPSNRAYTPASSTLANQNFTGAGGTGYFIRGYVTDPDGVPINNVLVSLSGTAPGSYTTTSTGYYEFTGLATGNYSTTFVKSGWSFAPASNSYTSLNANQESQNVIGVAAGTVSFIRGYVKDANGKPIIDTVISLSGSLTASYTTKADGYYEFLSLSFGSYLVTAVKTGWTFSPSPKAYTNLYKNKDNQNISGFYGTVSVSNDVKIIGNIFNPANGEITTIWYNTASAGRVSIRVYSSDGILLRELVNEEKAAGTYTTTWAGTNLEDQVTASGIYYLKVTAPGVNTVKKICIVK